MMDVGHAALGRREFHRPGATPSYAPDLWLEPVHLEMDLRVDVDARRLDGRVLHHIQARSPEACRIRLHAVDFARLEARDLDGHEIDARYDGRELLVTWKDAFDDGETRRLELDYTVENPSTGLFFSAPSETNPDATRWAATDHETERARHWLPTVDLPNVRPTLEMTLRADEAFTLLGPGLEVGEEHHDDGTKSVHWKLDQPCPSYLTCFAVGDFVTFDDGEIDEIACQYFTTPAFKPADLERSFGRTKEMVRWMTKKLDHAFPFPKYFQFALPDFGGAMENISLVAWDDKFVLDPELAREWTPLVDLINVHEMAHSYFGDMVVCRDYAHAWLKESWATYIESLWLEDERGKDEADYHLLNGLDAYRAEADGAYVRPIATRVFDHSWKMYDRHLYPGGAVRLHMLRSLLGDEAFFRGVRDYLREYAFDVVETSDFRRSLEEASGRSLARFFDQWILGKGYPKIRATYAWDAKQNEVTLTLEQTQANEKEGIPVFDLLLDVSWTSDGKTRTREVHLEKAKHVVVLPAPSAPTEVRIDPEGKAVIGLEFNPSDEMLRRQLTQAADVRGRILAARELAKTARRKNIEAIRDAYPAETFWGVRCQMAKALADAGTEASIEAVAWAIGTEQDPQVLEPLFTAAGRVRDPRVCQALEARLDGGLDLIRARAAALEALGRQREDAPYDRLVEEAKKTGPYGFEQAAAFRALAETRREAAIDVLLARLLPGATSDRARPAAALALGRLNRGLPAGERTRERITEALLDRLDDASTNVRAQTVMGLAIAGDRLAVGPLERYARRLSDQERVAVERAAEAIRAAQKPRALELEKKVEELTRRLGKMDDLLEKMRARQEKDS